MIGPSPLTSLRPESRAKPAGPRPTSPREGAISVTPAELRREGFYRKVPKVKAAAPTQDRAQPSIASAHINLMLPATHQIREGNLAA